MDVNKLYGLLKSKPAILYTGVIILLGIMSWLTYCDFFKNNTPPEHVKVVEVFTVSNQDIHQTVHLIGTVKAKHTSQLTAKTEGIVSISVVAGQKVKKGDVIAHIENEQINNTYTLTQSAENIAKEQYERTASLSKTGAASRQTIDEKKQAWIDAQKLADKAKSDHENLQFIAPFDGIVGAYKVREGAQVHLGDQIVSVFDPGYLIVEFDVPADILPHIEQGQQVVVSGKTYSLTHIQKMLDEDTYMAPAHVDIDCSTCILGSATDVELTVTSKKGCIVIPFEAVFMQNGKTFIYKVVEGKAISQSVTLGIRHEKDVEVTEGLSINDNIVRTGQDRLYPNIAVKIADDTSQGQAEASQPKPK
jgi:membrane fusion protein (multidrug efflux system)